VFQVATAKDRVVIAVVGLAGFAILAVCGAVIRAREDAAAPKGGATAPQWAAEAPVSSCTSGRTSDPDCYRAMSPESRIAMRVQPVVCGDKGNGWNLLDRSEILDQYSDNPRVRLTLRRVPSALDLRDICAAAIAARAVENIRSDPALAGPNGWTHVCTVRDLAPVVANGANR
jgi:hypothetical protein